jgi:PAS domain S-box-containing protein
MGQANPIRVLYVEDDQGLARLLQKRLERAGFHVDIALDGGDEFAKHSLWNYDILAVDHDMPGKSGLELIRDLAEGGNLPVTIMITGAGDEGIAVEAMKLGASDYVIKDADSLYLDSLPSIMEKALSKEKVKERNKAAQEALKRSYHDLEKRVDHQEQNLYSANQKLRREIEGREKAEAAFRVSENRFRVLFEESLDALALADSGGGIIDVNRSFCLLFGLDQGQLLGQTMEGLFMDHSRYLEFINELEAKGFVRDFEWRARTANSEIRECMVTASLMPGSEGVGFGYQHIIRDITVRKEAERAVYQDRDRLEENVLARTEELLKTNERLKREIWEKERVQIQLKSSNETIKALLDASNDQVALLDKESRAILVNETLSMAVNMPSEQIVGRGLSQIWDEKTASSRAAFIDSVVESGESVRFQDNVDGEIYENTICPVRDSSGGVGALALFIRNVTDQVKAQELQVDAARFKAVADLASGVAHNFNNLLQIVLATTQSVMFELEVDSNRGIGKTLDRIVSSCKSGAEMVRRLQQFAGVRRENTGSHTEIFDVSEALKEAAEMTSAWRLNTGELAGVDIRTEIDVEPGCMVRALRSEMMEVFINLIKNAAEALPDGGLIRLESDKTDGYVNVRVIDNGIGISEENQRRLFTPFFTTKISSGAGLGLATSKVIVERRDGAIYAESSAEQGAAIHIKLPEALDEVRDSVVPPTPLLTDRPNLLLIDDDITTLFALKQGLEAKGYHVLTADSGVSGVDTFMKDRFDVIISDLGMPGMNGWETAKRIHGICEENKIPRPFFVILTGWGGQAHIEDKARRLGIDAVIEKPASIENIISVMAQLKGKT